MSRLNCHWCIGIAQQNKRRQGPIKGVGGQMKSIRLLRETGHWQLFDC